MNKIVSEEHRQPDGKFYFVYETTDLTNGRFYIGKHETDNLNDGYLGSGEWIVAAIKKRGKEKFKRKILCFCTNNEEAYTKERELVSGVIEDKKCTNLIEGGNGFTSDYKKKHWLDPHYRFKMTEVGKLTASTPNAIVRLAAMNKEKWQDPEYIAMHEKMNEERWKDPEYKSMMIENSKKRWEDPLYKQNIIEKTAITKSTIEGKLKQEETNAKQKILRNTPEWKARQSVRSKSQWDDPEYKAKTIAAGNAIRNQVTEKLRTKWADPVLKAAIVTKMRATIAAKKATKNLSV